MNKSRGVSMGMPLEVVLVRHGQSEANIIQQAEKEGREHELADAIRSRPDWMHRLMGLGCTQGETTGKWIDENIGDIGQVFEGRYYSNYIRARETAVRLGGAALTWRKYNLLHERDWGHFGTTPRSQHASRFPETARLKQEAPLYARLDGGEALADNVTLRVRSFRDMLKRKWDGKRVIAVTHGDVMSVVRYVFEDMLPEQWDEMDRDKAQRIGNCSLLRYSSVNPFNQDEVLPYLGWRQMIQPNDLASSPFNGEWCRLPDDRFMTGAELLDSAERIPRLLSDD